MEIEVRTTNVLVKLDGIEEEKSSLLLPDSFINREKAAVTQGKLVGIGPDAWKDYEDEGAKIGDRVVFAKYAGFSFKDKETKEEFTVMNDTDIKATLKRGE